MASSLPPSPSTFLPRFLVHRQYNEDLFEHTKMTFGEHLEELRRRCCKAVLALVIGVSDRRCCLPGHVVDYVQTPLKDALQQYYSRRWRQKSIAKICLKQRKPTDGPVPQDFDAAGRMFAEQDLVTEEHWIDPRELAEILKSDAPNADRQTAIARIPMASSRVIA